MMHQGCILLPRVKKTGHSLISQFIHGVVNKLGMRPCSCVQAEFSAPLPLGGPLPRGASASGAGEIVSSKRWWTLWLEQHCKPGVTAEKSHAAAATAPGI